ncbi:alpha/beta hydrolase [Parasphingorhabdus halotolerans]|uniref:Alpha/beta hydrolase n=2 Tax=Parasphingorhabdus halotolerans TaxID=2725558 RepID=A0A6H2DQ88_9SPHN|nr:alpha/beta hydrolase [Parasphingorhabdus halotolerans]
MYHKSHKQISLSGALWLTVFAVFSLVLPQKAAQASGSYTVTETVETLEYEIIEPASADQGFANSSFDDRSFDQQSLAIGEYGPFRVVAPHVAEMTGTVDSYTPALFRKMLQRHPGIKRIEMLDCDGSVDEEANLNLARMIRRAGINTHVPANGSIRSGAVELFLAGVKHTADDGAEFVVHSWMDEDGLEANDYPAHDPVHAEYLGYYAEMGVPAEKARAFYALTNSVPFSGQLKLSRNDLAQYQLLQ